MYNILGSFPDLPFAQVRSTNFDYRYSLALTLILLMPLAFS